ncbi:hypothetical protein MHYP_G00293990 [Metynnis hypsauchen]
MAPNARGCCKKVKKGRDCRSCAPFGMCDRPVCCVWYLGGTCAMLKMLQYLAVCALMLDAADRQLYTVSRHTSGLGRGSVRANDLRHMSGCCGLQPERCQDGGRQGAAERRAFCSDLSLLTAARAPR